VARTHEIFALNVHRASSMRAYRREYGVLVAAKCENDDGITFAVGQDLREPIDARELRVLVSCEADNAANRAYGSRRQRCASER